MSFNTIEFSHAVVTMLTLAGYEVRAYDTGNQHVDLDEGSRFDWHHGSDLSHRTGFDTELAAWAGALTHHLKVEEA